MRYFTLLLLLLSFIFSFAQTAPDSKLELLDIFELQYASDPQISPDGEQIVYVRNYKDVMTDQNLGNLWVIDYEGKQNRPLTDGKHADRQPRWSPSGDRIAFISNREGMSQIFLYWKGNGTISRLTNLRSSPSGIQWSPDGKYLAFTMSVSVEAPQLVDLPKPPGADWAEAPTYIESLRYRSDGQGYLKTAYRQLFLVDVESGHVRALTDEPFDHSNDFCWTPDAKSIIFSANRHNDAEMNPANTELYRLTLSSGEITALTSRSGPDFSPAVSSDGKYLAYLGYDEQYLGYQQAKPYLMDLETLQVRTISTELDRNFGSLTWDSEGKGLFFQYDNLGSTKIAYLPILGGKLTELVANVGGLSIGRPYSGGTFSVSSNDRIAYTLCSPYHPAEVGITLHPSGRSGRLTELNQGLFAHKKLGKVEEIWFESTYDGRRIQGWVVFPPDFDPEKEYPLLLEIHGGPFANYGSRFSAEIQLYAAAGYVVLYTNPRGSTSYGAEFANLIHHNYPSEDYDDLMSGIREVISRRYIDTRNLFITGGSGGGVLTAWTIGQTNIFRAAVVAKPVINWYSFVLYADNPAFFYKYWFPGFPWDENYTQQYLDRSPLSLVGNVSTPTMLLTGEQDYRTPIAESEQYYTALKLRGVEAAMVRIPEASHGIASKPSQLIAKVAYILGWFERYRVE